MARPKAPPSMRLTKAKKPPKPPDPNARPKLFGLAVGTPNQLQPSQFFEKEEKAREEAMDYFRERLPWCARFNKAGEEAVMKAIAEINDMPVLIREPREVACAVDEYYGTVMVVRLWKRERDPGTTRQETML